MTQSKKLLLALIAGTAAPTYYLYRVYRYNLMPRYSTAWTMLLHDSPEVDYTGKQLGYYYGDFRKCLHDHTFDENGIIAYKKTDGIFHNPTAVAEHAIIQYENFLRTKEQKYRDEFKKNADWLLNNATSVDNNKSCFYYLYNTPEEKAPWGSGIAQGIGISALVRAAQTFEEPRFLQEAERAFGMLDTPVQEGGFRFEEGGFGLWYEEDNHQGHILNGHIYALLGVYDLYRATQNELYKERFMAGVQTIKNNISLFDLGFNTKYRSDSLYPANAPYHSIHITLFQILHKITADDFFLDRANRFNSYHSQLRYRMITFQHILKLMFLEKIGRVR